MDPLDLEDKITANTKAVIVVHMLGNPARIKEIKKICTKRKIYLIEDTAWGCGAKVDNKFLGTWGDIGTFSFDFAKTITTGEGGMLIINKKEVFEKASAWHDHGHENNPSVPRWEDTRKTSGFNFRMSELQGAVGIAQLKKLDFIISNHKKNKEKIWNEIKNIKGIKHRSLPKGSYETAESLVFFVENKSKALLCREKLLENGIGTKILPEAITWHYASTWKHIEKLSAAHENNLEKSFPNSDVFLSRSVSIPINIFMEEDAPIRIKDAIERALNV